MSEGAVGAAGREGRDGDEGDDGNEGDEREPEVSAAVRVVSAVGLFLGGLVAALVALIGLANVLDAARVDGDVIVWTVFTVVGVASLAALVPPRWRPFGAGAVLGVLLGGAAVSFFVIVLKAGEL